MSLYSDGVRAPILILWIFDSLSQESGVTHVVGVAFICDGSPNHSAIETALASLSVQISLIGVFAVAPVSFIRVLKYPPPSSPVYTRLNRANVSVGLTCALVPQTFAQMSHLSALNQDATSANT